MSLRTPLNKVLGLGSAKDGTSHFWAQRVSGAALALLGSWFAWSLATLGGFSHPQVLEFVAVPMHTILLVLLSVTVAYHSYMGVQVVIEDYVHSHGLKLAVLVLSKFAHTLLAVASLYAVMKIGLGA